MNQFDEVISMNFGSSISNTKPNLQKFNEMAVFSLVSSSTQIENIIYLGLGYKNTTVKKSEMVDSYVNCRLAVEDFAEGHGVADSEVAVYAHRGDGEHARPHTHPCKHTPTLS